MGDASLISQIKEYFNLKNKIKIKITLVHYICVSIVLTDKTSNHCNRIVTFMILPKNKVYLCLNWGIPPCDPPLFIKSIQTVFEKGGLWGASD